MVPKCRAMLRASRKQVRLVAFARAATITVWCILAGTWGLKGRMMTVQKRSAFFFWFLSTIILLNIYVLISLADYMT